VGHETDITLADLAADVRAPTPTAAAELAAPRQQACLDQLDAIGYSLRRRIQYLLDAQAQRLDRTALRLSRPSHGVQQQAQRLALLAQALRHGAGRATQPHVAHLAQLQRRLQDGLARRLAHHAQRLHATNGRLQALNPQQVLARGYAWLADDAGRAVVSARQLVQGAELHAVLADGVAQVRVGGVKLGFSSL
jgi:exodeoxyribonuclease VII large subunit